MSKFDWEKEMEKDSPVIFEKNQSHTKKKSSKSHDGKKKPKPFERKDKWDLLEE